MRHGTHSALAAFCALPRGKGQPAQGSHAEKNEPGRMLGQTCALALLCCDCQAVKEGTAQAG